MVSCSQPMASLVSPTTPSSSGESHRLQPSEPSSSSSSHHHLLTQAVVTSSAGSGAARLAAPAPVRGGQAGHHPPLTPGNSLGGLPNDFPPPLAFARPMRAPFFIREIYKNGFLKRLPYNEKKSSALAKLMKSDRFWVVFSVHDDSHPFLELWHEPTEVAGKPPQYIFPLAACQHISPSLTPADSEWSFVINFDTVAIRFSCSSREVMEDWVEVIRNKLGDMGILNPRGNLYSRTPLGPPVSKPVIRDPTSPLPQPPALSSSTTATTAAHPSSSTSISSSAAATASLAAESAAVTVSRKTEENSAQFSSKTKSVIETTAGQGQTFTTSIYLNQSPELSSSPLAHPASLSTPASGGGPAIRKASLPPPTLLYSSKTKLTATTKPSITPKSLSQSLADITLSSSPANPASSSSTVTTSTTAASTSTSLGGLEQVGGTIGSTSSVYLNPSSPTRHVTVIPINSIEDAEGVEASGAAGGLEAASMSSDFANHTYGAIFDFDTAAAAAAAAGGKIVPKRHEYASQERLDYASQQNQSGGKHVLVEVTSAASGSRRTAEGSGGASPRRHQTSPKRRAGEQVSPRRGRERSRTIDDPPPLPHRPVLRRLSERKLHEPTEVRLQPQPQTGNNLQGKARRKSRRSSSLGPLLDANSLSGEVGASTLSLESVDSNPRQAVPKSDRQLGAVPRRGPLHLHPPPYPSVGGLVDHYPSNGPPSPTHPLLGSPPRNISELPPGFRPPPYHSLATPHTYPTAGVTGGGPPPPLAGSGGQPPPTFPPMVPLPGLTCQLSIPGLGPPPPHPPQQPQQGEERPQRSLREQQVLRLRQETAHPAGVRLILRKKDVLTSLALVDLFGCVWVAGWKQREYPVLFNAFHLGDQILSVSGMVIRNSHEFSKLIKHKSNDLHAEIIIRRVPFAQVFHLKSEIEGQSLGIIPNSNTSEIKEIIPGSVAAQAGVNSRIRSIDGQSLVPLAITELNGRPVNMFSKDGETWDRLQGCGRELSIILQPTDILAKIKKQFKSIRGYKDYILS